MLQTTIYRKQTDQQNYLDAQSEHSKFLKDSIPYSQALQQQFLSHTTKMINQFQKLGHSRSLIEQQVDKANLNSY